MWITQKQYDRLLEENEKLQKRLNEELKTEKKFTEKDMDSVKEKHTQEMDSVKEMHKESVRSCDRDIKNLNTDLSDLRKRKDEQEKILNQYTEALQKMANDRGANDIALLIINDIKNFDTFKSDFIDIIENKIEAEFEKKFQKELTAVTKGNMGWVQETGTALMFGKLPNKKDQ